MKKFVGFTLLCLLLCIGKNAEARTVLCSWVFNPKISAINGHISKRIYENYASTRNMAVESFVPRYGYLKGFTIEMPLFFLGKLDMKHGVSTADVRLAFDLWNSEGLEIPISFKTADTENNIRYFFIARIRENQKNEIFLKVILDVRPDDSISLTSAYPVYGRDYFAFLRASAAVQAAQ